MKMKEFGPPGGGGCVPSAPPPLGSANAYLQNNILAWPKNFSILCIFFVENLAKIVDVGSNYKYQRRQSSIHIIIKGLPDIIYLPE